MKSIFNADDNAELLNRIDQLAATSHALWGKMNAAQMLAHCRASMNIAFGISKKRRHWLGRVFGHIGKRRLLKVAELDRLMPTYKTFEITDNRFFDEEKEKFTTLIKSAFLKGEACLVKYPHPYFKTFKPGEWSQLNWKHLDHHLRQFGV
ncbi:MAG: hypothetical protein JWQ79_743 [Mucilaginibacter sp.]|jgi:hypothetical protein|nr:hypothetical protein [Mucilaginibacter sp.]